MPQDGTANLIHESLIGNAWLVIGDRKELKEKRRTELWVWRETFFTSSADDNSAPDALDAIGTMGSLTSSLAAKGGVSVETAALALAGQVNHPSPPNINSNEKKSAPRSLRTASSAGRIKREWKAVDTRSGTARRTRCLLARFKCIGRE